MSEYDSYDAELQLYTLIHRGQWMQALTAIDAWRERDPWRTELLLRKAQVLRALHRYEQGLLTIREYRAHSASGDVAFLEVDFLLDLGRTTEALRILDALPAEQRSSARGLHVRGRVLLALHRVPEALESLWQAFHLEPGFHRALVEWAAAAAHYWGKGWVRRQLEALLVTHGENPTIGVGIGLALAAVDPRQGQTVLRRSIERYPLYAAASGTRRSHDFLEPESPAHGEQETYRAASEHILTGRYRQAVEAYDRAVQANPVWIPVLAPLVAEMLMDELARPEEARRVLEEALRRDASDYRLHLSYARVFLHLGFGEEALSASSCAMVLAPQSEKGMVLVQRAAAYLLLRDRERALNDLADAIHRMPEARSLIRTERFLRPLARHSRFRALVQDPDAPSTLWERVRKWLFNS